MDYFIKPFYGIFIEPGIFMESFECCSPEIGLGKREDQKTANKNIRTLFDLSHVFFGEGLKCREGFSGVKLKNNTPTKKQLFLLEVHLGGWHNFETSRYFCSAFVHRYHVGMRKNPVPGCESSLTCIF